MKSFEKLVRDGIQDVITQNGEYYYTRRLKPEEFEIELKKKLLEESQEVNKATTKEELTNELADVLEVINYILKTNDITLDNEINSDELLPSALGRILINEATEIKTISDKDKLTKKLNLVNAILNKLMKINEIAYEDVEKARIDKKEKRGGFDRRVFLKSTITLEELARMSGCKTCVNRNCTHNWYLLNGEYDENGEVAGKYCVDYISNYRQRK